MNRPGPGKGPAVDIGARKVEPPVPVSKRQTNAKPRGTYKIYGPHHDPVKGSSPLHTRIKGSVYAPTTSSKFKKGQSATVDVEKDKLKVSDPNTGHSQVWSKKESLKRYVQEVLNEILRQNNVR